MKTIRSALKDAIEFSRIEKYVELIVEAPSLRGKTPEICQSNIVS